MSFAPGREIRLGKGPTILETIKNEPSGVHYLHLIPMYPNLHFLTVTNTAPQQHRLLQTTTSRHGTPDAASRYGVSQTPPIAVPHRDRVMTVNAQNTTRDGGVNTRSPSLHEITPGDVWRGTDRCTSTRGPHQVPETWTLPKFSDFNKENPISRGFDSSILRLRTPRQNWLDSERYDRLSISLR